ncbi:hypothetical protein ACP70R_021521 [Stipagrostis hirtigluma subsp. patula]
MSTRARLGGGGGGRQFPVGRRRHAPVADAGCGCRPRRPRLLSLPSFLKPSQPGKAAPASGSYSRDSSSSTASFSSCSAATNSTGDSSAYSSDYYSSSHVYGATGANQDGPLSKATKAASPAPAAAAKKKPKQKRYGKAAAAAEGEDGVGVAVEKESSDPRADFRESMVQMVVEMGLCDWDGLRGMLRRLLALNSPRHHAAILAAFAEVCAQLVAATTAAAHPQPPPSPPTAYQYGR